MVSTDLAEFSLLAQAAGVDPEKMGAAFNDPTNLFGHITPGELDKIQVSCARFALLSREMEASLAQFMAFAKGFMAARNAEAPVEAV